MTSMHDPFDDLRNGHHDGGAEADDLVRDEELAGAERFAEVLDRMAAGGGVDLDPREDPTLAALTTVAAQLDDNAREATSTPRYASYRARSREYLLGRIERERAARHAPQPEPAHEEPSRGFGIPFLRLNVLTHFASAAAAAVVVLAFVVMAGGSESPAPAPEQVAVVDPPAVQPDPQPAADPADATDVATDVATDSAGDTTGPLPRLFLPSNTPAHEEILDRFATALDPAPVTTDPEPATVATTTSTDVAPSAQPTASTQLTSSTQPAAASQPPPVIAAQPVVARTLPEQLEYIDTLLSGLTVVVERDLPVSALLLRELTESIAAVAYHIESSPDSVTSTQVVAYIHSAAQSRVLLAAAVADEGGESSLSAARSVAQSAVATASWYLKYH